MAVMASLTRLRRRDSHQAIGVAMTRRHRVVTAARLTVSQIAWATS